jgi:hypothetical protein
MRGLGNRHGELLLPMLAVLFLFGIFWVAYVRWCEHIYWRMRMDMAADAVALSASREEASMLNTIGTMQYLENLFIFKADLEGEEFGAMQKSMVTSFQLYTAAIRAQAKSYTGRVLYVARLVAKANGANHLPVSIPLPQDHLKFETVRVLLFDGIIPDDFKTLRQAYFARDWWPRKEAPQPIQRATWLVGHDHVWEKGKARLWLDVDPHEKLDNGGFPREMADGLKGLGIQCNYPQFNARLMPKFFGSFRFYTPEELNEQQGSGAH